MIDLKLKDKVETDAHKSYDNLLKNNYTLEGIRSAIRVGNDYITIKKEVEKGMDIDGVKLTYQSMKKDTIDSKLKINTDCVIEKLPNISDYLNFLSFNNIEDAYAFLNKHKTNMIFKAKVKNFPFVYIYTHHYNMNLKDAYKSIATSKSMEVYGDMYAKYLDKNIDYTIDINFFKTFDNALKMGINLSKDYKDLYIELRKKYVEIYKRCSNIEDESKRKWYLEYLYYLTNLILTYAIHCVRLYDEMVDIYKQYFKYIYANSYKMRK